MFFSSKKVIGLDLGSSSIKLAVMNITKSGAELENFALIQTPSQAVNNGEITDSFLIGETIKSILKSQKFGLKNACIGLWGNSIIVKKISMPRGETKNLREQISFEAQQYLPFDISQVTFDYHIINQNSNQSMMDVLLIAAQNDSIDKYLEVSAFSGLKCKILDVSSLAFSNLFEFNYGRFQEPIALFNFGANSTQFIVVLNGQVLFVRDIPVGGFHFTNEISKNLGITLEEAESIKLSEMQSNEVPENTTTYMNLAREYVTEEIKNSLDFYAASGGDLQIARAVFTGGASLTKGLTEHLQEMLKIPFEEFNPLMRISIKNKKLDSNYLRQVSPFLATSLGLALRQGGDT